MTTVTIHPKANDEVNIDVNEALDRKTYYEIRTTLIYLAKYYQGRLSGVTNYRISFKFPSNNLRDDFITEIEDIL